MSVVDFIIKLEEAETQLKKWEAEKAKLNSQYGTQGHSLMVFLQNRILEHRSKVKEEDRQVGLKNQVEKFRQCMKMPINSANDHRISSIVGELQYLYGSFNNELFESELNDLLAEEIAEVGDMDSIYGKVNGHIGQWRKKLKALWDNVHKVFKEETLPKSFKTWTLTPHCSQQEIAEAVIRSFAKDWRNRACKFDRPVSIYGTDINTMPKARKEVWWEAYKKLELNDNKKYPKRQVYMAVPSKEKDPHYIQPSNLTGKFGGGVTTQENE